MEKTHETNPCTISVALTHDEADALLQVLLNAPVSAETSEELVDRLLSRLTDAQRLARHNSATTAVVRSLSVSCGER